MKIISIISGMVLIFGLSSCQSVPKSSFVIDNSNFDSSSLLMTRNNSTKQFCNASYGIGEPPVILIDLPDRYTGKLASDVSAKLDRAKDHFMSVGEAAFFSKAAKDQLRNDLLAWVDADALQWPETWNTGDDRGPATVYFTTVTLLPMIVTYGHHKNIFDEMEVERIENWFRDRLDTVGNTPWMHKWKLDNKKYLYGSVQMALGIITDDVQRVNLALNIYETAIQGMRKDGSLPGDSGRWGSAIHYTNAAIASLVVIAEMAANQGIDLYSYQSDNKSLDHAIAFLISATKDPSLIADYAKERPGSFRGYSATNQKIDWNNKWGGFWGHYYTSRFPESESAKNLRDISTIVRTNRSEAHDISGGNPLCFVHTNS
jgi:hypothetical protein